jgi:hypothetical protein
MRNEDARRRDFVVTCSPWLHNDRKKGLELRFLASSSNVLGCSVLDNGAVDSSG